MTRKFLRLAQEEDWTAGRDARGAWVVLDRDGHQPLRAEDPGDRLRAVHLAAQAPAMEALLRDHVELLELLAVYDYLPPAMLEQAKSLIAASAITLKYTRPLKAAAEAADTGQREMDLDAA